MRRSRRVRRRRRRKRRKKAERGPGSRRERKGGSSKVMCGLQNYCPQREKWSLVTLTQCLF